MESRERIFLIANIVLFVLGLFFIMNAIYAFSSTVWIVAGVMIAYGASLAVAYWLGKKSDGKGRGTGLWLGCALMLAGVLILIFHRRFSAVYLPLTFAACGLALGIDRLGLAIRLKRGGVALWALPLFGAGLSVLFFALVLGSVFLEKIQLPQEMLAAVTGIYLLIFSCLSFGEMTAVAKLKQEENVFQRDGTK